MSEPVERKRMGRWGRLFPLQKVYLWFSSLRQWTRVPSVRAPLRQARVLIDTSRAITSMPDVVELMTTILDQLQRAVPYTSASIHIIEGDKQRLVAGRLLPDSFSHVGMSWPRSIFPLNQEIEATRVPLVIDDVRREPRWRSLEGIDYIRSWLGLPLSARDDLIGFLLIDRDKVVGFRIDEVETAQIIASQLALALRLADLVNSRQRQVSEMTALYALSRTASSSLQLDQLLPALANHLQLLVGVSTCSVFLLDERGEMQSAAADEHQPLFRQAHTEPDEIELAREVVRSRAPIVIANTLRLLNPQVDELSGTRSCLGVPLLAQGEPIGAVVFSDSEQPHRFSDEVIERAEVAVGHAALAIANSRLFESTRRHARELALRDQVRMAIAAAPPERNALAHQVTRSLAEIFGYAYVNCWAPIDNQLLMISATGQAELLTGITLPLDRGICGRVVRTGVPCLVENVGDSGEYMSYNFSSGQAEAGQLFEEIKSEICVPVHQGNEVVLVLNVEHTEQLSQRDLLMLTEIATQVGLALENVQLVNEIQRVQEDLARSARMAAVGTLAAGVAHEFNNMLGAMLGYTQLGLAGESADQVESLQKILTLARRGKEITDSMLAFAATDTRRPQIVDLHDLADQGLARVASDLAEQGITVQRERNGAAMVTVDAPQFVQVVVHLLTNACDAMSSGGTLTLRTGVRDQRAELVVQDTGPGIATTVRERIFEPFVTTKGAFGDGRQTGVGLGLSVCYSIVYGHGGTIEVSTDPGAGSCFTVLLPLHDSLEALPLQTTDTAFTGRSLRVLVVDDDKVIQVLLRSMLLRAGYTVLLASEVERARALVQHGGIDLLLCDLHLPGIPGDTFVQQLYAEGSRLPVVLMTGRVDAAALARARSVPVASLLTKPFQAEDLFAALATALATNG